MHLTQLSKWFSFFKEENLINKNVLSKLKRHFLNEFFSRRLENFGSYLKEMREIFILKDANKNVARNNGKNNLEMLNP